MCEYEYNERVSACCETRIYPSDCCPNDECECRKNDRHHHGKCCEPEIVTGEDGVNRINFCPPCSNNCK